MSSRVSEVLVVGHWHTVSLVVSAALPTPLSVSASNIFQVKAGCTS